MDKRRITELLKSDKKPVITVFGDYSLDKYLYIDRARDELSLETGLIAYQVTHKKLFAGAAGTIVNNLLALGAEVYCVGFVGDDGEGHELKKALAKRGARTDYLITTSSRSTGTYIKPMAYDGGHQEELNRLDIKNFTPTPRALEDELLEKLALSLSRVDGVIVSGQYLEEDCASLSSYVKKGVTRLAGEHQELIWYVDSRKGIDEFKNLILKCNHLELAQIFKEDVNNIDTKKSLAYAKILYGKSGRPVYVTLGERGSVLYDGSPHKIPAFRVQGQIDVVGAGDACNAGIVFSLIKGASFYEAGLVGNALSSIVIKKIGETGTGSLEEINRLLEELE